MQLDSNICERARLARDPRFDGLFFTGVKSTGIYCRPICPAPTPKAENVDYYATAAAAAAAGLRPCLRCRPEASPGSPAWNGTSTTVSRAMRLISEGALNEGRLEDLANRVGVGERHLRRLFQTHVGASPIVLAANQKTLFAKKLLNETHWPISDIAFASGFGSIRRFNAAFQKTYGKTPSDVRRPGRPSVGAEDGLVRCELNLAYRPPFDWPSMLEFYRDRAIPGVEWVADDTYHRTVRVDAARGAICVSHTAGDQALRLTVALSDSVELMPLVERVRRMFDLDANMAAIHEVLAQDFLLRKRIQHLPGLRLPGAWDPFETAVRAVVGQQISVKGSRTIIGRIAERAGPPHASDHVHGLTRFFPSAAELGAGELGRIGMPAKRVAAVQALARAVAQKTLSLAVTQSLEQFVQDVKQIPGIGEWTAQYMAMRALGEPDAFPAADLGIIRALEKNGRRPTPREVLARAEQWRPWRAYAAIHLWRTQA